MDLENPVIREIKKLDTAGRLKLKRHEDEKLNHQELGLKTWFDNHAYAQDIANMSKTFVCVSSKEAEYGAKIIGYISLAVSEVSKSYRLFNDETSPYSYPSVRITKLLVDRRARAKDIGRSLVKFAIGRVQVFISPNSGCRLMIVDAFRPAIGFYRRFEFDFIENKPDVDCPPMFLDLNKVQALETPPGVVPINAALAS